MNRGNFFRRTLTVALSMIFLLSAAIVGAKVQMYTATGEDYPSEIESMDISKQRALDKAIKKATKEAGVYLKSYSRSVNSELTDDEIIAITSNNYKIIGEPKYAREVINHSADTQIIVWKATVDVNVDDSEIQNWIKRDDKEKSTIITQTRESQKASEENERKVEDLREQYKHATTQAEKDNIRKQLTDADRDFLANLKIIEGQKLYFANNYNEAIKSYNEAIRINKNSSVAYLMRGCTFGELGKYELAIKDFNKTIELNPNYSVYASLCCGVIYSVLKKYETAIQYYDKTISLDPNYAEAYAGRGVAYMELKQTERAIKEFDKAIELGINNAEIYTFRGTNYFDSGKYDLAFQCFDKAIKLNPNNEMLYVVRAAAYCKLKQYDKSIADATKAIQLNSNFAEAYLIRGICYQELGQPSKFNSDIVKARQLGYNG